MPPDVSGIPRPSFTASAPTLTGTIKPTDSYTDIGPVALSGGTYAYPTVVEIEVKNMMQMNKGQSLNWTVPTDTRGALVGDWDAGGVWASGVCYGHVRVGFNQGGVFNVCDGGAYDSLVWTKTLLVQGAGSAYWDKGPYAPSSFCNAAGMPPCYTFTGDGYEVKVTPLASTLSLKASRYVTTPAKRSVTFTGIVTPDLVQNLAFTVLGWKWIPDAGSPSVPGGCSGSTCTASITVSGNMQIKARVNGVEDSVKVHIRALCDSTADPQLDSLPILDAMKAAFDASGDPDVEGNQGSRAEKFWRMKCQNGICTISDTATGTPCHVDVPGFGGSADSVVAEGHTHPFHPGHPLAGGGQGVDNVARDTMPAGCKKDQNSGAPPEHARPGPSPEDYNDNQLMNGATPDGAELGIKEYIMDADNIYVIPGGVMTLEDRKNGTRPIPRVQGGCRII